MIDKTCAIKETITFEGPHVKKAWNGETQTEHKRMRWIRETNLNSVASKSLSDLDDEGRESEGTEKREERAEGRLNGWWSMEPMEGTVEKNRQRVCVPVGPVCLGSLVLAGGWQSGSVFMRVRVCVHVWVCRRVGGARGALRGRVVRVGGWRATVVQTVELVHLFICRLWTKMETGRMSHPPLLLWGSFREIIFLS